MSAKELNIFEKKPVVVAGHRQNCYIVDGRQTATFVSEALRNKEQKKYDSLERVQLSNGFVEQIVQKDYPITSESVSSYADGADYRKDPSAAIANAPKRTNLGDVSELQDFMRDNPQQALLQYKSILDKVERYFAEQAKQSKQLQQQSQQPTGGTN